MKTDSVEDPVGFASTGLGRVHTAPVGQPVTVRFTFELNPLNAESVTFAVAVFPCPTVDEVGVAEMEKSGNRLAYASTSLIRLHTPSAVAVTHTRIFEVDSAAKVNFLHTRLLFVTVPPGIGTHAVPFQYCTSKSRNPYRENVIVGVGSTGA